MQLLYVYLNCFRRNSLLKCVSQPKIAKKIHENPYFGVQGHPRSLNSVVIGCTTSYLAPLLRYRDLLAKNRNFSYPLSFSALFQNDLLRIYGKALQFLKLESPRQPTVKIWRS